MKFTKIVGKIDPALISEVENKITKALTGLASAPEVFTEANAQFGGNPFYFSILYTIQYVATLGIPTLATDGKRIYVNPVWLLKRKHIGVILGLLHEAGHNVYDHVGRIGAKNKVLFNIAIDYFVHYLIFDDYLSKNKKSTAKEDISRMFRDGFGQFITVEQYAEWISDPHNNKLGSIDKSIIIEKSKTKSIPLPDFRSDVEITDEQKKEIENRQSVVFFYADPDRDNRFKTPEQLYAYFVSKIKKCPKCHRLGWSAKDPNDPVYKEDYSNHPKHGKGCDVCLRKKEGDMDILGMFGSFDEHIESECSAEELSEKLYNATQNCKKMAGKIPGEIESTIDSLIAPKMNWKDAIKLKLKTITTGNSKNDWSRYKSRPLMAKLVLPKRYGTKAKFAVLLDCSGSMDMNNDIAKGLSQLISINQEYTGVIVPADAKIYWDQTTVLNKINPESLLQTKIVGRGGTMFSQFFSEYEKKLGQQDLLIVITDGYLDKHDISQMRDPKVPVVWLITNENEFIPPFGKAYQFG